MKVLILANNDIGLYNFRKELIYQLLLSGNAVYLSLPYGKKIKELVERGCRFIDTPIDRRGINPIRDLGQLKKYLEIIAKIKPDVVLSYTIKPNIYGGIACRLLKKRFIPTITGLGSSLQKNNLLSFLIKKLYKFSLKNSEAVIFENKQNLDYFVKNKLINPLAAVLLNGAGVNINEYEYTPLKFNDDRVIFLFMGRIMKEKGIDELFYAAERIKNENLNVEFIIIGFLEEHYEDTINDLVKRNVICFYGFQEDVKKYIDQSHCIVLPSYHEGMSNTLLEAASKGRPLITSNIHGCKEAVVNNKTGYLCNVGDKQDLYNKIIKFIHLPIQEKIEMGKASRKHIESNFDRERVVQIIVSLLKQEK